MASLSLCFPFNFLGSSTQIRRARQSWMPVSSSASSTRTPVSSPKNAWLRRSRIDSLMSEKSPKDDKYCTSTRDTHVANKPVYLWLLVWRMQPSMISLISGSFTLSKLAGLMPWKCKCTYGKVYIDINAKLTQICHFMLSSQTAEIIFKETNKTKYKLDFIYLLNECFQDSKWY